MSRSWQIFFFWSNCWRIWNKYSGISRLHSNGRSFHWRTPRGRNLVRQQSWNLCIELCFRDVEPYSNHLFSSAERNSSHRQQCTAAEALTFLSDSANSVFSDWLAIMANICNYEVRIDSKVLEQIDTSFSACALTLAVLNGDMSLLAGCLKRASIVRNWMRARECQ